MLYEHEGPEGANFGSQREFARSLVESMGEIAALQVCRDNEWYGIFDILVDEPATTWSYTKER